MNNRLIDDTHHILEAYELYFKGLCREFHIPFPAFGIIMALAENPQMFTAKAISTTKTLKPNLISFHVEKLVQAGLLGREPIDGNRRSIKLVVTPQAQPLIERGNQLKKQFFAQLWHGISADERALLQATTAKLSANAKQIKAQYQEAESENL